MGESGAGRPDALPENRKSGETDALAVELLDPGITPTQVYPSRNVKAPVSSAEWQPGQELCFSGVEDGVQCGNVVNSDLPFFYSPQKAGNKTVHSGWMLAIKVKGVAAEHGDSGSPVWNNHTGRAVGIIGGGKPLNHNPKGSVWVVPLEPLPYNSRYNVEAQGILLALSHQAGPLGLEN